MNYRERANNSAPIVVAAFGTKVVGMNLMSGARVWQHDASVLRVEMSDDRVFVAGVRLACLDAASGAVVWQVTIPTALVNGNMLVTGELIVLAAQGEVACFDANTGAMLWHDPFKGMGVDHVALAVPGKAAQADLRG